MAKSFGRDDMHALIGGGTEEMAAFRPSSQQQQPYQQRRNKPGGPKEEIDYSKLTAAQTAALLAEKRGTGAGAAFSSSHQGQVDNLSRYRTKKVLAHHKLLEEELSRQALLDQSSAVLQSGADKNKGRDNNDRTEMQRAAKPREDESDDDNDDDGFIQRRRQRVQAAVVIRKRSDQINDPKDGSRQVRDRRRRSYDSSSSSDDNGSNGGKGGRGRGVSNRRQRARGSDTDSSSDDDEVARNRRCRLLAARQVDEEESAVIPPKQTDNREEVLRDPPGTKATRPLGSTTPDAKDGTETQPQPRGSQALKPAPKKRREEESDSDNDSSQSDDSSSGSSDSDDGSSDSSEDEGPVMTRAVFVPKHKRGLVHSEELKWQEEEMRLDRERKGKEKRRMESRALVAKQLAEAESSLLDLDDQDDETGGATNAPPNDDDEIDREKERDAWEVRELERLLRVMDQSAARQKEEEEYKRRKQMTDEEVIAEDIRLGRYQAPGSNRHGAAAGEGQEKGKHIQRFYHRGAYYMDESEWDEGDVRNKAAEYAQAATGEDKFDKSKLPEVMQVKNFGHARQNRRYKGLAKEDTTDKSASVVPLVHGKSGKGK